RAKRIIVAAHFSRVELDRELGNAARLADGQRQYLVPARTASLMKLDERMRDAFDALQRNGQMTIIFEPNQQMLADARVRSFRIRRCRLQIGDERRQEIDLFAPDSDAEPQIE